MKKILIIPIFYIVIPFILASVFIAIKGIIIANGNDSSNNGEILAFLGIIFFFLTLSFFIIECFDIGNGENAHFYKSHKNEIKIKYGICIYDIDKYGLLYDKNKNIINHTNTLFLPNLCIKYNKISKMKKSLIISCSVAIILFLLALKPFNDCTNLYNKSVTFRNSYEQKVFERKGFYDKMWKSYSQKYDIAHLNNDMFTKITKLIMENRADGKQLIWKWLQENQNIPYGEFTRFYDGLTQFVEQQRDSYFALEKECMNISKQNNVMLDLFPNVLYNKILNLPKINYEAGFSSDKTDNVFSTKQENNIKDDM